MSDWDFLHDMHDRGCSAEQIADAAACGYDPWEWSPSEYHDSRFEGYEAEPELIEIFDGMVDNAKWYYELTGRYLQIWGELGELYAEVKYGIKRHKPHTQGSDGRLGNDFIEIKTISPEKNGEQVLVKLSGNFNKLLVVKISQEFEFESRFLDRKNLPKGAGKHTSTSWSDMSPEG